MSESMTPGASSQAEANQDTRHGYAPVNGLDMYYEIHGTGKPVVLLHGAFSAIGTSFGQLLPALASTRQVIAVEQQGHGHTADIDRPLIFEGLVDDTVALLRYLGIDCADFLGYSMGGGVALALTIRHPEMVRKLIYSPSQLAILPGTDHVTLMHRADLLLPIVGAFLDAPMPERA